MDKKIEEIIKTLKMAIKNEAYDELEEEDAWMYIELLIAEIEKQDKELMNWRTNERMD